MSVTITRDAADRKAGMTLDELAAFVQESMRCGIDGGSPVHVTTGFASQIRKLQVTRCECGSVRDEDGGDPTCPRCCPCRTVTDGLLYTCPACVPSDDDEEDE